MSILDDAREGMDTAIRPQDDLFGHMNGRWLVETEIPSDRSSWGPFVQLADTCEQQVRDIITDLAEGASTGGRSGSDASGAWPEDGSCRFKFSIDWLIDLCQGAWSSPIP